MVNRQHGHGYSITRAKWRHDGTEAVWRATVVEKISGAGWQIENTYYCRISFRFDQYFHAEIWVTGQSLVNNTSYKSKHKGLDQSKAWIRRTIARV